MPTEKTRTVHVRRIKNEDNEEVWIDVERVDKLVSSEGQGPGYKKTTRKMFWGDEASNDAHPTRNETRKRIENPEDAETFVELPVIDRMRTQRGQGPGYLKSTKRYVNDRDQNQTREVSIRRVYHWDTETDPNEDGGTEYVRTEDTEDRSQYIDVAVIEKLISSQGQGPGYKKRTFRFNTGPIKEFSEPSPSDVDMSKVVYLDPWQNIINVQWGHPFLAMGRVGGFGSAGVLGTSPDGITWTPVNYTGPAPFVGAYGNGRFVIGSGTPASMSVSRDNGKTWTTVAANPFAGKFLRDIVFGNGVFLAVGFDTATGRIVTTATSEDGETWSTGTPPLSGEQYSYKGTGFSGGKFIIFGAELFSEVIRDLFGYDFVLNEPIYSSPFEQTWTQDRFTVSDDGVTWGSLQEIFSSVTFPGEPRTVTFTHPFEGWSLTFPRTDPDVYAVSTAVDYMANYGPPDGPYLLGMIHVLPGVSLALSSDAASWSIVGSNVRNLSGLAGGNDSFIASGSSGDDNGFFRSPGGSTWQFQPQDILASLANPPAFGKQTFVTASGASIFTSTNGLTWIERSHPLGVGTFHRVIY